MRVRGIVAALTIPCAALADGWPTGGAADYQLGGAYPPDPRVTVVARDSTEAPIAGLYNICYVNGFQTQPGDLDWWNANIPAALLRGAGGAPVSDPAWPDEYAFDTRSSALRAQIAARIGQSITRCARAGFDAVEFDNLDSWTRFDRLTAEGNLALAALLVERAHALGLAAGQKNAPDLGPRGPAIGFDFVISEECAIWDECAAYGAEYGDRHIDIEYTDDLGPDRFRALCGTLPAMTVLRDRALAPRGAADHAFALCD